MTIGEKETFVTEKTSISDLLRVITDEFVLLFSRWWICLLRLIGTDAFVSRQTFCRARSTDPKHWAERGKNCWDSELCHAHHALHLPLLWWDENLTDGEPRLQGDRCMLPYWSSNLGDDNLSKRRHTSVWLVFHFAIGAENEISHQMYGVSILDLESRVETAFFPQPAAFPAALHESLLCLFSAWKADDDDVWIK